MMNVSSRKTLFLIIVILLIAAESLYFGRQAFAGYQRLLGRRAFINNEFGRAWEAYGRAIRWGGNRDSLELEVLDLLVFGLLQSEAGIDLEFPVSAAESLSLSRDLVARRLRKSPYDAHLWSRHADLKFYDARQARRGTLIDLSRLSEDPLDNLREEERAGIEALRMAASLEPNNYFFHDLLASFFMEIGAPGKAAPHVRRAVASYPRLAGHAYLTSRTVPGEIVDAAVEGFRDASENVSLVRRAHIEIDAGRLLMQRRDDRGAIVFLEQAIADAPELFESHYRIGQAFYRLENYERAIEHLRKATDLLPSVASVHYYLGRSYRELGNFPAAIEALTLARQKRPERLKFRHELGKLLEESGQLRLAERQFVAAANMRPEDPVAWLELTRFYSRVQDRASALEACARLLSLDEDNPDYQKRCDALRQDSP
jgi:tetratricopeptide (TPR) repeat protein